jgi:probable phosphoglycerate mutase
MASYYVGGPAAVETTRTRLVLVRHGQSQATVDRVAGGDRGCRGLTPLGVNQAEALRDRLVATGELATATALLSSTLPRALETAEVLASALGLTVVADRDLRELDPGDGDGLTWDEWEQRFGDIRAEVEPYRPLAPGGESWAEFELRVGRTLTRLVLEHAGGEVVVACHGGIIGGSLAVLLGLSGYGPRAVISEVQNTSITEWMCAQGPSRAPAWRLVRFNDAGHLDADGRPAVPPDGRPTRR